MHALDFYAGPRALARLREHGLRAADVAVIPAAAGGPKGLIFRALDQYLFGQWLAGAPRVRTLIGASIGAWRMAAACQRDPHEAFARLARLYVGQRYTAKPDKAEIDRVLAPIMAELVDGQAEAMLAHPFNRLHVLAARGRGLLADPTSDGAELRAFAAAAGANLLGRARLAGLMERVFLSDPRDQAAWLHQPFDAFTQHVAALTPQNVMRALLASGTLPTVMQAVRDLPGAPAGTYWDGGMIDYHLAYPYQRLPAGELVLYPHFMARVTPGWLDKALPWRRAHPDWLSNVLLVAPSTDFIRSLPRAKLPDRADFPHYGLDHAARMRAWNRAMDEAERLRDDFAAFAERSDLARVRPL
ncbi:patatin-like phospholipase family protein [Massilia sp. TS11]|uniref:patatin-like phospholipase family protein n=1 Tax=Massilia sp. TS11 TaxID=2908003 RepID=UPI001EDC86C0|nr:patatin-like phospholipase family protein [Massilia sp. TS11]MCG2584927.1 patatin-like phospholipase family protein [Massilia sp. TS11]